MSATEEIISCQAEEGQGHFSDESRSIYPIRVIDVKATIEHEQGGVVFVKPTSWNFHVISHTWSKGIQSWSDDVVNELKQQLSGTYEALFRAKDFRSHNSYEAFIKFLRLLQSDGVERVWLDALCINQDDGSNEKIDEIQRMGSYYAKSIGCYVCAQGFGESFKHLTTEPDGISETLPRWFSRVWTFQEFLLPPKLTFIFSLGNTREAVIESILQREGNIAQNPCECPLNYVNNSTEQNNNEQYINPCRVCGGSKSIRVAYKMPKDERNNRYFIDRETFTDIWSDESDFYDKLLRLSFFLDFQRKYVKKAEEVHRIIGKEGMYSELVNMAEDDQQDISSSGSKGGELSYILDPVQVIVEIARRHCSHDEDRVLSVLGLLGFEGESQIRLKKSLRDQLLDLAQKMAKSKNKRLHTVLVQLCITQFAGSDIQGMSWAPSFKDLQPLGKLGKPIIKHDESMLHNFKHPDKSILSRFVARRVAAMFQDALDSAEKWRLAVGPLMVYLKKCVAVPKVLDDGTLKFKQARVLWNCSFTHTKSLQLINKNGNDLELELDEFSLHVGKSSYPFQVHFTDSSSCLLVHHVNVCVLTPLETNSPAYTLPTMSVVNLPSTDLDTNELKVHLVLLGQMRLHLDTKNEILEVMMICKGDESKGTLQKVGIGWMGGLEPTFLKKECEPICVN